MSKKRKVSPEFVPAAKDPGDDTASRFAYQWTYAAVVCCMLLDDAEDVVDVFCEHHEDILLKHADDRFSGLQIKTRASDQTAWKFSDEAVRNACARFAQLERDFPSNFISYKFLTNHPLHAADNFQCFQHILKTMKDASSLAALEPQAAKIVEQLAKLSTCDKEVVFSALRKTSASDDLPKIRDIKMRLCTDLASLWPKAKDCTHAVLVRAAGELSRHCADASSLAHAQVLPAYLAVSKAPVLKELATRLAAKRIDKSCLLAILEKSINATAPLSADPRFVDPPGAVDNNLLLKKIDAGGFSEVSRNSAADLRNKADYLALTWVQKHGDVEGLKRYDQVRSIVLREAAAALEETKTSEKPFGVKMLIELRKKIKARRKQGADDFFDCRDEHVEGFAFGLTAECKIIWSSDRPWESV
jgi:hypothetical protein